MKKSTDTSKRIPIGIIQRLVAKECLFYGDSSKSRITEITRRYFSQLKKDGFVIRDERASQNKNARRVNYFMEKYQKLDN
tara:strand:- start:732 stop:971 length:240 start_codon:yes stop_codon:yes gene_type:complete